MCVCVCYLCVAICQENAYTNRKHKRMLCLLELDLNEVVNPLMCFIKQNQVRCWSHM